MKKSIYLILSAILICFSACQEEDEMKNAGYLRLNVMTNTDANVQTRVSEDYNPKQFAVRIVNSAGTTVQQWEDHSTINDKIALSAGDYIVYASSNGFDGEESGFEIPYYEGSQSVTITKGKEVTVDVECTLANVKVSVEFDESIQNSFQSAVSVVSSTKTGINPLQFVMGETTQAGYFPVADLIASLTLVNKSGVSYTMDTNINGVSARDYYKITYKLEENGPVAITVWIDDSEIVYSYTFNVSISSSEIDLAIDEANAWSTFAYLKGSVIVSSEELNPDNMSFQYQSSGAETWEDVAATYSAADNAYAAKLTGLTAGTTYNYRLVYRDGDNEYDSDIETFTTENATELVNGNMDDWYQDGRTWYPASEAYYTANGSFWDSSNPGTTTGAGALINVNPTQGSSTTVHTSGGQSAQLQSQWAGMFSIGQFAAASLYTGSFNSLVGMSGAIIDFGQPFTDRPTQLHGWFQYATGEIDYLGDDTPADLGIVKGTTLDVCSIYLALSTKVCTVDNTDLSTFIDLEGDDDIIAYGELPVSECNSTDGAWKEFTIDLKYKSLTTKPSYLIIVCSSSKYGDYFTGSTSSLMYIDDMELIYGDDPMTIE